VRERRRGARFRDRSRREKNAHLGPAGVSPIGDAVAALFVLDGDLQARRSRSRLAVSLPASGEGGLFEVLAVPLAFLSSPADRLAVCRVASIAGRDHATESYLSRISRVARALI